MKTYQIRFCYGCNTFVSYVIKAKNYDDAVEKFTRKYGTLIGGERCLMGNYKIELVG